jgi:hypothetical protein
MSASISSKNSVKAPVVATAPTVTAPATAPATEPTPTASIIVVQPPSISSEIQKIFDKNKLSDLKEFVGRRKCLNEFNMALMYLFHIVQSAGILTTTIAAGYDMKELVWIGVGINIVASLINIFEKTNAGISKRLLKDIEAIRDGTFVDESDVYEPPAAKGDSKPLLDEKSQE